MKRIRALLLAAVVARASCAIAGDACRVAMITDYADITDQSFNQTCCEASNAFCESDGIDFTCY